MRGRGAVDAGGGPAGLRLGGLTPLSTTDFPDALSAVLFCQGCPWRCAYCHNPHLIAIDAAPERTWEQALGFLRGRVGLLDAVVFSGGEPTLQDGLADAMRQVRSLGFAVGLHTAGVYPERLAEVLPLLDWVGLDVKAPFERYEAVNGGIGGGARALASLRLIVKSGVGHECRTTVHPSCTTESELVELCGSVRALGARRHVLQAFRAAGCRDESLRRAAQSGEVARLLERVAARVPGVVLRGL